MYIYNIIYILYNIYIYIYIYYIHMCGGKGHALDEYARICALNKVKNVNVKVFNLTATRLYINPNWSFF